MPKKSTYLNPDELKTRGWTPRIIKSLLGKPEEWDNSQQRTSFGGFGIPLHDLDKVIKQENHPDFKDIQESLAARRAKKKSKDAATFEKYSDLETMKFNMVLTPEELARLERGCPTDWNDMETQLFEGTHHGFLLGGISNKIHAVEMLILKTTAFPEAEALLKKHPKWPSLKEKLLDGILAEIAKTYPSYKKVVAEIDKMKW